MSAVFQEFWSSLEETLDCLRDIIPQYFFTIYSCGRVVQTGNRRLDFNNTFSQVSCRVNEPHLSETCGSKQLNLHPRSLRVFVSTNNPATRGPGDIFYLLTFTVSLCAGCELSSPTDIPAKYQSRFFSHRLCSAIKKKSSKPTKLQSQPNITSSLGLKITSSLGLA